MNKTEEDKGLVPLRPAEMLCKSLHEIPFTKSSDVDFRSLPFHTVAYSYLKKKMFWDQDTEWSTQNNYFCDSSLYFPLY